MPSLPQNFAALALVPGIIQDESHFLFMTTGQSGTLDLFIASATGNTPVFTLNTKAIYDGSGVPSNDIGGTGDYYIDYHNYKFYGPKTGEYWETGVNLVGPTGATGQQGSQGIQGVTGSGIITGGNIREILGKASSNDYDMEFFNVHSLIRDSREGLGAYSFAGGINLKNQDGTVSADLGSGCCFCPSTNTIFVIVDGSGSTPELREYTLSGHFKRSITLTGWYDIEAIDMVPTEEDSISNNTFTVYLSEERTTSTGTTCSMSMFGINDSTTLVDKADAVSWTLTGLSKNTPNEGIEALCYNLDDGYLYYILQVESGSGWYIYKSLPGDTDPIAIYDMSSDTSGMTDIRDMCYNRKRNSIVIVGYVTSSPAMLELAFEDNISVIQQHAVILDSTLTQPEGISVTPEGTILITGEDGTNGADLVFYTKNTVDKVFTASNKLLYPCGGSVYSINSKIFEGLDSGVFTQDDSIKSIVPSLFYGSVDLFTGSFDYGNRFTINANGYISVVETTPGTCLLEFEFNNKIGSSSIIGMPSDGRAYFSTGVSYWKYKSDLLFRSGDISCFSELEIYNQTYNSYTKVLNNNTSALVPTGQYSLVLTTTEGGTATYTYNLSAEQFYIEKN